MSSRLRTCSGDRQYDRGNAERRYDDDRWTGFFANSEDSDWFQLTAARNKRSCETIGDCSTSFRW